MALGTGLFAIALSNGLIKWLISIANRNN